jgi:hypothetical protein
MNRFLLIREAIVNAQLDHPKMGWRDLLSIVLLDGERYAWRDGGSLHVDLVQRVFVTLHKLDDAVVRTEILANTDDWSDEDRAKLPWS